VGFTQNPCGCAGAGLAQSVLLRQSSSASPGCGDIRSVPSPDSLRCVGTFRSSSQGTGANEKAEELASRVKAHKGRVIGLVLGKGCIAILAF
jgi:hypothetical protein